MGTYTEFTFKANLVGLTAKEKGILSHIVHLKGPDRYQGDIPDHDFFKCERWYIIGVGSRAYMIKDFNSHFNVNESSAELYLHSSFKNHDGEIEKFCDWIEPFVDAVEGQVLGEMQGDDYFDFPEPHLIVYKNKKLVFVVPERQDQLYM